MKRVYEKEQRALRKAHGLPKTCECGGRMVYDYEFERIWSHCASCTPVVIVKVP